ncbi:T9SS type A sorting domain-containing protein [Portibacter marinus]|uniref:T9SS type A sorting domain-containing protein n=1 Tax=Portibacter marinus TaxID=2898660 RepID=UPI001F410A8F|nr:T9SS type A sorting domain-containing protein [Portibacter marinus]
MKAIWTLFFLAAMVFVNGQSKTRLDVAFENYQNPLTGGFEAPQFQAIHLNEDGEADLLVFDRKGSAIRTFIYDENMAFHYRYAPEYESVFPDIPCWVIVKDFNLDGVDDLFTCGVTDPVTGIEVWIGKRENGHLSFEAFEHPHGAYNIIYYNRDGDYKQLYVGNNGIPGIADVDDDGDIDILAFQPSGGYLYYFKNLSQEKGFGSDSLLYERVDDCWGNFYEGGLIPDIILSKDNSSCAIPNGLISGSTRHEGITVSILDKNNDGLQDLLLGEVSSTHLIYIENGGSQEDAFATYKEVNFPTDDLPAEMQIFLASFILDVDHDGVNDLLVAPNSQFGTNTDQVLFYQGVDTNFNYIQDDWLVGTTLDLGTDSYPSFLDYNSDGLMDLVVGSFGLIGIPTGAETRLYLFENVGSLNEPKYELVDDNWLDFLAFSQFDKSFTPTFGDLDSDGDQDLLLGTLSGELVYLENTSGPGNPVSFKSPVFDYKSLDSENNTIRLAIADVDGDGLNDIVVGGRNSYPLSEGIGSLKAFKNIGSPQNPDFSNSNVILGLGQVNVKDSGTSKASAAPRFYSDNMSSLLLVANETGRVAIYDTDLEGASYDLISEDLLGQYLGRRLAVDVADIDGDGYLEMVIGNERGGLNFYNTIIQTSGEISSVHDPSPTKPLALYPNPVLHFLMVPEGVSQVEIFNTMGQRIRSVQVNNRKVDVRSLPEGTYFLKSSEGNARFIKKGK